MSASETPLQTAERHVRLGAEHSASQERVVRTVNRTLFPKQGLVADELMATLRASQRMHQAHLDRIRASV